MASLRKSAFFVLWCLLAIGRATAGVSDGLPAGPSSGGGVLPSEDFNEPEAATLLEEPHAAGF